MASGSAKTTTRIKVLSREVRLTYLQSVELAAGDADLGLLVGEGGGVGATSSSYSNPGSPGFLGLFGVQAPSSGSKSANDTGWEISRQWKETSFDRARYAIGLKDIGVFFYRFTDVSEFVSVPFASPKEISKVQMRVIEKVPGPFKADRRYLEYYVSPDNGKIWHRINPLDQPTITNEDGQIVPRTLTFNSEIGGLDDDLNKFVTTDAPVFSLRYRVVIRSDPTVQDPDRYSPELRKVSLIMYPRGGLRQLSS